VQRGRELMAVPGPVSCPPPAQPRCPLYPALAGVRPYRCSPTGGAAWRRGGGPPSGPTTARSAGGNAAGWQARGLSADPPAVGLVCPGCWHATVFLWELLAKGQQLWPAGRRPGTRRAPGGRRLPGPHRAGRRGAPPLECDQVPGRQGVGRVAAGAARTGPLRHLTPGGRSACDKRRLRPTRPAAALRLAGQPPGRPRPLRVSPRRSIVAGAPSGRTGPLPPATSAASMQYSVPPAVRSLRDCKHVAGAARGPHRHHLFPLARGRRLPPQAWPRTAPAQ
jgi:hypothetical protein